MKDPNAGVIFVGMRSSSSTYLILILASGPFPRAIHKNAPF